MVVVATGYWFPNEGMGVVVLDRCPQRWNGGIDTGCRFPNEGMGVVGTRLLFLQSCAGFRVTRQKLPL